MVDGICPRSWLGEYASPAYNCVCLIFWIGRDCTFCNEERPVAKEIYQTGFLLDGQGTDTAYSRTCKAAILT